MVSIISRVDLLENTEMNSFCILSLLGLDTLSTFHGQGLRMTAMLLPVVAVCIWSLGDQVVPVDSAHFMGGLIYWRPVNPAAFDGIVRTHES